MSLDDSIRRAHEELEELRAKSASPRELAIVQAVLDALLATQHAEAEALLAEAMPPEPVDPATLPRPSDDGYAENVVTPKGPTDN